MDERYTNHAASVKGVVAVQSHGLHDKLEAIESRMQGFRTQVNDALSAASYEKHKLMHKVQESVEKEYRFISKSAV
jgi:hypothetical protein